MIATVDTVDSLNCGDDMGDIVTLALFTISRDTVMVRTRRVCKIDRNQARDEQLDGNRGPEGLR